MASVTDFLRDVDFESLLFDLADYGWFDYVFPFLLVYALVFTILNKVELFEERKGVKVIIAVIFGLFAIAFPITDGSCTTAASHYSVSNGCTLGDLMMTLFPGVTAFTIGILALYIVAAMLGVDLMEFFGSNQKENAWIKYVLGGLGVLVVVYYYALGFGWGGYDGSDLEEFFSDPLLYILVVFGLVFWLVTKDDGGNSKEVKDMAKRIQEQNPNLSKSEAMRQARDQLRG